MKTPLGLLWPVSNLFRHAIISVCVVAVTVVSTRAQDDSSSSLHGVWSMTAMANSDGTTIEPAQPGVFIFTENHYSAVYTLGTEPRPSSADAFNPTPEEMAEQYERLIVNTGTCEVDGSTVTMTPLVAKSPGFIGGSATMGFQIEGDMLTLTVSSIVNARGASAPDVSGVKMMLRRLE